MPTALCHGVELFYERAGGGPRLLFCNGSGTTIASTRGLLNRLAEHFDLVCFDYRGMGLSAPLTQPYRMADVAADALALQDHLGWQQAPICGWSCGGMVAQRWTPEWLAQHPDDAELAAESDAQTRGRLWQLQARKDHNVLDRLGWISCPTWVANGRFDGIAPPANGQAIAQRVTAARFQTYEGGHAFFLQDPTAWSDLVAFLSSGPS